MTMFTRDQIIIDLPLGITAEKAAELANGFWWLTPQGGALDVQGPRRSKIFAEMHRQVRSAPVPNKDRTGWVDPKPRR